MASEGEERDRSGGNQRSEPTEGNLRDDTSKKSQSPRSGWSRSDNDTVYQQDEKRIQTQWERGINVTPWLNDGTGENIGSSSQRFGPRKRGPGDGRFDLLKSPRSGWRGADNETVYQQDGERIQSQFDSCTNIGKSTFRMSLDNLIDLEEQDIPTTGTRQLKNVQSDLGSQIEHCVNGNPSGRGTKAGERKPGQNPRQRYKVNSNPRSRGRYGQQFRAQSVPDLSMPRGRGGFWGRGRGGRNRGHFDNKRHQTTRSSTDNENTENCPAVVKQGPVLLYVRIQQPIDQKDDITAFLQARMEDGNDYNFKVKDNKPIQGHTVICLAFEHKNQANRVAHLLKLSNQCSPMKLLCGFSREEAMDQLVEKDEEELKKQISSITKRTESVLEKHDGKIKLITMQLEDTDNKTETKEDLDDGRKEALSDKLTELTQQKEEFTAFQESLVHKITEACEENTNMKHITDLRREFGVECCRLENALPMYARRNDIIRIVKENKVSVILGETGSGKSTQMTQYLHQAGFSKDGIIVCTQPRKVAAISLATHVASEVATNVGNVIGYKVGMSAKLGGATKILYMTDHCLLNECLKDPSLSAYSCVIVDEAHERSIYTDLLLGMLKMCLKQRTELKAVITSATIDPDVFVHYFGGCPVLRVSGRMFPVEVVYEPDGDGGKAFDKYVEDAVNKAVSIHKEEVPGDIVVFVTTPQETEKCSEMLKNRLQGRTDFKCLILHGQIQPEEQQLVFQPPTDAIRKIVFATNSAETSITIPGIKYVIDTGLVKEKRYDPRRNMSSLSVVVISRSSADQRKGRAGRTGPGKCYRLYSEELYKGMEAVSQPEILKVHLGQAMLKLTELGIDPTKYDFVQSPGPSAIEIALQTLEELGAVKDKKITEDGKELAKLPVEPRLGLIIQKGRSEGIFFDAIVLAAVSIMGSSIFYRGGSDEVKKKTDQRKMQFCHNGGDSLTLLNVYRKWIKQSEKQKAKWCFDNSISSKTMRIVKDTVNDITTVLKKETQLTVKHELQDPGMVDQKLQKILFDSYTSNICHFLGHSKAGYYAAGLDQQVHPHPSSVLNPLNMEPEWLVFEQSLKTSKDFITGLTPVNESWIVEAIESGRLKRNLEEMRKKALVPVHTEHVGSQIFLKIVGPYFTKLRVFEAKASDLVKPALVAIKASKDKGEIQVFSSDSSTDMLSQLFKPVIDTVRESLLVEDLEIPLSQKTESGGIRAVLGSGGAVKDILMHDEYRTVRIEKTDETTTVDSIINKFSKFGAVKEHRMFKKHQREWGRITFQCADAAKLAVQKTRDDTTSVAVPEENIKRNHNPEFKVKITWCRRESKGFGYASVKPEDIPRLLSKGSVVIRGRQIQIQLKKQNQESLYLRNLGPDITEEDIKKTILTSLGCDGDDNDVKVTVVRDKNDTTQQQLDFMKQQLQASLHDYSPDGKFSVDIVPPHQSSRLFLAFATFTDANEGRAACQGLSKRMSLNGRQITMEQEIKSSLSISQKAYGAVREDVDIFMKKCSFLGTYSEVTVKSRNLKNGNVVIDIHGSNAEEVARARASLQEIIQGDVLDIGTTPNVRQLFTGSGRDYLRDAEKNFGASIQADRRTLAITIRGKKKARLEVKKAISDYLSDLAGGECIAVDLRGANKPKGLMKTLMNEYGLELEKLKKETGLSSIILNFKQQVVKMTGSVDDITKATEVIDKVIANIQEDVKTLSEEDERECIICLCPIEDKDLYRLEYCGHAYCLDCLKQQVECAVKDMEFPLLCAQDGCEQVFMWRDVSSLLKMISVTVADLGQFALGSFIKRNSLDYHYCPTPNCCMVYRTTSSGAVFHCPECDMRICTTCHIQTHEGLTCELYQQSKTDEGKMELWLAANSETTKKCPKCQILIEKISGCNRMTCESCKCSFCWVCLEAFSTVGDCYDHLQKVHKSYYD